jgi:signal transduction histidine kinase
LIQAVLRRLLQTPAWAWVGAFLAVVMATLAWVSQPAQIAGAFAIRSALVSAPSAAQAAPKTVALPHSWDAENPAWSGTTRYELAWPAGLARASQYALSAQPPELALYLPRVGARFRVLLNDQVIASQHWLTPGYVDTSVVPYGVALPAALLVQPLDANRISIEVQGQRLRNSGLSSVLLGPKDPIDARYDKVHAWQVQATWMVAACSALLAVLAGVLWLQNRDHAFGLLALAFSAWVLRLVLTPLVHPPMPFALWFYLHKLSFTLYCGFMILFLWDIFGLQKNWGRKLVLAMLWAGPVWLGVTTLSGQYNLYRIWSGVILVVSNVTFLMLILRARKGLDDNQRLLLVASLVTSLAGIRDFAVVQLGMPGDGDIRWMTLGSLVFMLTMAWILIQRTNAYVQQIGQLNQNLELRVAQKESQLVAAFDQLRESERRDVLQTERQRLTRDMHDGLGSQLVQTLNLVRGQAVPDSEAITGMLHHALQELRMTLDSLEPMEGDLPAILGTLRRRIAPALEAAGIELDWQVQEVPPIAVQGQPLEALGVMHLFRFLQEVFANIIKHASASRVEVRTWSAAPTAGATGVLLSVTDNGCGMGAGYREGGRGMDNLRARAHALGAQLRVTPALPTTAPPAQPGTRIELEFMAMDLTKTLLKK